MCLAPFDQLLAPFDQLINYINYDLAKSVTIQLESKIGLTMKISVIFAHLSYSHIYSTVFLVNASVIMEYVTCQDYLQHPTLISCCEHTDRL